MQHEPGSPPRSTSGARDDRPVLAAYLSGHGFGHFTRSEAVLAPLAERFTVHVRTSAQALRLARRASWPASVTEVDVGPGVVQVGPLAVDPAATLAAVQQHLAALPRLVEEEAAWLAAVGARAVFADVPPLAFAAAARAGLPSLGMSNFSWSWIYGGYAHHDDGFARAANALAEREALATAFLHLAGGGGLWHFPGSRPCPPIVRRPHPALATDEGRRRLRDRLGVPPGERRPLVVVSFGGFGAELGLVDAASHNTGLRLLVVSGPRGLALPHARSVEPDDEVTHPDLVAVADCLLGKPGYGTVAECLLRPTPFVHVPRGEFREEAELVTFARRHLPEAALSLDDFLAGRWQPAVEAAMASRPPAAPPPGDGIAEAGAAIAALITGEAAPRRE